MDMGQPAARYRHQLQGRLHVPHHLAGCAALAVVAPGGRVLGHPSPHISAGQQPPSGPDAGMGDAMQSMENPVSKRGRYQWSYDTC